MSSIETAQALAARLDATVHEQIVKMSFHSINSIFINLRAYLQKQNDRLGAKNNIFDLLKKSDTKESSLFSLGPQIDKGDTDRHFHFPSGSRLSFGITVRKNPECSLIAFRFHYHLREGASPEFIRFDLNPEPHQNPLIEPRCHLHPGLESIRIPTPALCPFEILDRIFFVLESV